MKLIIILTQWLLLKSLFIMLRRRLKGNGERGLNMLRKERLSCLIEGIGLLLLWRSSWRGIILLLLFKLEICYVLMILSKSLPSRLRKLLAMSHGTSKAINLQSYMKTNPQGEVSMSNLLSNSIRLLLRGKSLTYTRFSRLKMYLVTGL